MSEDDRIVVPRLSDGSVAPPPPELEELARRALGDLHRHLIVHLLATGRWYRAAYPGGQLIYRYHRFNLTRRGL